MTAAGSVRIGIGGWSFAPWRETFYPAGTRARDELPYAASVLGSIEINATFYRTQTPPVFAAWRDAVPGGFVFSVKAPRGATYGTDPERVAAAVERFLQSGVLALGAALGPILWQFPANRRFDAAALERFLGLLPAMRDGVPLRHALELRHPTAQDPALGGLLAAHGAACLARVARPGEPAVFRPGPGFAYVRIEETEDAEPAGLAPWAVAAWSARLAALAHGRIPADLAPGLVGEPPRAGPTDVFAYVIAGAKHRNPAAALALRAALDA